MAKGLTIKSRHTNVPLICIDLGSSPCWWAALELLTARAGWLNFPYVNQREVCPDLAVNPVLVLSKAEIVISLPSRRASMSASRIGSETLILNGSILRCLARKTIPFAHVIDLDDDELVTVFLLKIHSI